MLLNLSCNKTRQLFPTDICLSPLKTEFSKGSINCRIILYKIVEEPLLENVLKGRVLGDANFRMSEHDAFVSRLLDYS